ncbi:tetratricopeptide repeat protein (macronuclear) [Tetrahymena thermophila SB210]|uniref:Tetratricopeptide repeat protein n=1 Tax=Tetrahymena thermophila (strain SB210) TaxID=312017 RepID=W7X6A2_TETTS|nr:tetratricopeptide repeat protein [Tetrahymena thermophila SB210]EWS74900.1 tetratricopeptide repeat protein [Tetrahymena thermophila SB210]|eukprot:XP_012652613.1 tetratricopeptide repeat protein [Tetrahymena thermophila SB210]
MELIIKQLETHKQIKVTKSYIDNPGQQYTVIANDNQNQYSIKVISLHQNDGEQMSQQKLEYAKQLALSLKSCNHENIAKYLGEFQIQENYFILLESFEMNLIDWQVQNKLNKKINRKTFIQFALQLFHALEHIHSKNYVLQKLALRNIYLDKDYNIKLSDFGFPQEVIPSQLSRQFMDQKADNIQFYLPPELLDISKDKIAKQKKVLQENEGDIWVVSICLYALTGPTLQFIKKFTEGSAFYIFYEEIDQDINKVLMNSFWLNTSLRPKVSDLILSYEELQKINVQQLKEEYYEQEFIDKYNKARNLYSDGRFQESIQLLKEAFKIDPSSYYCLNLIGNNYLENKQYEEAIDYYKKSINIFPENAIVYKQLGHCYFNLKQYEIAIENLKKSIEYNPEYSHAFYLLGVGYEILSDIENSVVNYFKASTLCPQQCLPFFNLGTIYFKEMYYEKSIKCYQKCIELNPNKTNAYINLGANYCRQNLFKQALIYFEKASEVDPLSEKINYSIYFACMKLQRHDHAISYFKNRLKINGSQQTNYYLALTLIQHNLKNLHKSIHYLKQQIKLDPQCIQAISLMVDSFLIQENYSKIIKYTKTIKSQNNSLLHKNIQSKSKI